MINKIQTDSIFSLKFSFDRLKTYFEYTDSDELILLKGHLLIEEFIDWRLTKKIDEKDYKNLNLNFYKKVILFDNLSNIKHDKEIIKHILEINRIRNIYAHKLDSNIKDEFISYITKSFDDIPKTIETKKTYLNTLRKLFYVILIRLYGFAEGFDFVNDQ